MGTYVVTGSASGIGAATVGRLKAQGHDVIGVDRANADVEADLSDPDQRARAVAEVVERCDATLAGLCTAAGVGPPGDPATIVAVNYFGSVAFLDGLRPALAASGDAQVVAISSNSTTVSPNTPADLVAACLAHDEDLAQSLAVDETPFTAYPASKIAIAHWVRLQATTPEWAGSGIRLNAIAPGATQTPMLQATIDDEVAGPLIEAFPIPIGGFGTPDQIAAWIEQMLTGDGAAFLCGSVIFVDGGSDASVRPTDWPITFSL